MLSYSTEKNEKVGFGWQFYYSINLSWLCLHLSQTSNCGTYCYRGRGSKSVCTTGNNLAARFAFPNTDTSSLHIILSTEGAVVGAVLAHFDLLDKLSKCATVASTVLSGDSNFLGAFSHFEVLKNIKSLDVKKRIMSLDEIPWRDKGKHTPKKSLSSPYCNLQISAMPILFDN